LIPILSFEAVQESETLNSVISTVLRYFGVEGALLSALAAKLARPKVRLKNKIKTVPKANLLFV
jgi:hypothetical protein